MAAGLKELDKLILDFDPDKAQDFVKLNRLLKQEGYKVSAQGNYGQATRVALAAYVEKNLNLSLAVADKIEQHVDNPDVSAKGLKKLQFLLAARDLYAGAIDGEIGRDSVTGLTAFVSARPELQARLTAETKDLLGSRTTLGKEQVLDLQLKLAALGEFAQVPHQVVTGNIGKHTTKAIGEFAHGQALDADSLNSSLQKLVKLERNPAPIASEPAPLAQPQTLPQALPPGHALMADKPATAGTEGELPPGSAMTKIVPPPAPVAPVPDSQVLAEQAAQFARLRRAEDIQLPAAVPPAPQAHGYMPLAPQRPDPLRFIERPAALPEGLSSNLTRIITLGDIVVPRPQGANSPVIGLTPRSVMIPAAPERPALDSSTLPLSAPHQPLTSGRTDMDVRLYWGPDSAVRNANTLIRGIMADISHGISIRPIIDLPAVPPVAARAPKAEPATEPAAGSTVEPQAARPESVIRKPTRLQVQPDQPSHESPMARRYAMLEKMINLDVRQIFNTGVIFAESRGRQFDKDGKPLQSPDGAIGRAQVLPSTGEWIAKKLGIKWDVEAFRTNAAYNTKIGLGYFNYLHDRFNHPVLALLAYNWGENNVEKHLRKHGDPRRGDVEDLERCVAHAPRETRNYIYKIAAKLFGRDEAVDGSPQASRRDSPQIPDLDGLSRRLTRSCSAVLVSNPDGDILFGKNADKAMPIASVTKLMTAYLVLDAAKRGEISLDEPLRWNRSALRTPCPSDYRAALRNDPSRTVDESLQRLLVISSNPDAVALQQHLQGRSDQNFIDLMNATAKRLGLKDTHYVDPTGRYTDNRSSADDQITMLRKLKEDFPDQYARLAGIREVEVNGRTFGSTLRTVYHNGGDVEFGKTGTGYAHGAKNNRVVMTEDGHGIAALGCSTPGGANRLVIEASQAVAALRTRFLEFAP